MIDLRLIPLQPHAKLNSKNFNTTKMKSKILSISFVIFFVLVTDSISQSYWYTQYDTANTYIQSIYFANTHTGWCIGGYRVFKTTNSGLNWKQSKIPSSGSVYDFDFVNVNTGVSV